VSQVWRGAPATPSAYAIGERKFFGGVGGAIERARAVDLTRMIGVDTDGRDASLHIACNCSLVHRLLCLAHHPARSPDISCTFDVSTHGQLYLFIIIMNGGRRRKQSPPDRERNAKRHTLRTVPSCLIEKNTTNVSRWSSVLKIHSEILLLYLNCSSLRSNQREYPRHRGKLYKFP